MWLGMAVAADALVVKAGNDAELRAALAHLENGTTLRISPGKYRGGLAVRGFERLVVEAADAKRPPEFVGGTNAWQFSRCDGLVVRHLLCRGQTGNGLNIDDGGDMQRPVRGVRIENVTVLETGPRGNFDGIKCSGLAGLVIEDCRIEGWGGQAIVTWAQQKAQDRTGELCSPACFTPPSFTILDLTAYVRPTDWAIIRAGLFNLFNAKYWWWSDVRGLAESSPVLDAWTQPGRNISASLTVQF